MQTQNFRLKNNNNNKNFDFLSIQRKHQTSITKEIMNSKKKKKKIDSLEMKKLTFLSL